MVHPDPCTEVTHQSVYSALVECVFLHIFLKHADILQKHCQRSAAFGFVADASGKQLTTRKRNI